MSTRFKEEFGHDEKMSDVASERAVLVGLFQHGEDAYLDVADILDFSTFTDAMNQAVYKCVQHLYEKEGMKQFDQSSLLACAHQLGYDFFFEHKSDIEHLRSLMNGKVRLENIRTWAAQIRKLQIARMLRDQLREAAHSVEDIKGTEPIESILGIAESVVFDFTSLLNTSETSTPVPIGDGLLAHLDYLEDNPIDIVGISSGMSYYDQSIGGGFRRKTVSLLAARPKVGKSMLAANIGLHVAKNIEIPILYLDTEMTSEDHWSRLIPNLCVDLGAHITISEFETGKYANSKLCKEKVREAADTLTKIPFHYLNVSGKPFEEILSIMRRWVSKEVGFDEYGNRKDCLIIYDYMKMMSGDGLNASLKEYQVLGFMTTSLHNFAVRNDVPVLSFIQLNRDGVDREASDVISGSDRILWLVTNFTIFKVKTPEEIAEHGPEHGNRKMVPISARHGEGLAPGDYINVHFDGRYGRIREGETKINLLYNKPKPPVEDAEDIPMNDNNDDIQSSDSQSNN